MVVFDRDGNFLKSWGEGLFVRPHGVHMAPDDTIYCTDDGDHTVRHLTLDGRVLMQIGIPGKPSGLMSGEPFCRCTVPPCRRRAIFMFRMVTATHVSTNIRRMENVRCPGASPDPIPASSTCPTTSPVTPTAGSMWRIAKTIGFRSSTETGGSRPSGTICTGRAGSTCRQAKVSFVT